MLQATRNRVRVDQMMRFLPDVIVRTVLQHGRLRGDVDPSPLTPFLKAQLDFLVPHTYSPIPHPQSLIPSPMIPQFLNHHPQSPSPSIITHCPSVPQIITLGPSVPHIITHGPSVPHIITHGPSVPHIITHGPLVPHITHDPPSPSTIIHSPPALHPSLLVHPHTITHGLPVPQP
ncbi:extensin-like [Penaeus japonicus]|uniref:extensin-like n=1 Tax=Penaeus japonicus TaxID=27405 RepID=UPI001C713D31|nr:extensin-like [Penaeus japonicus]